MNGKCRLPYRIAFCSAVISTPLSTAFLSFFPSSYTSMPRHVDDLVPRISLPSYLLPVLPDVISEPTWGFLVSFIPRVANEAKEFPSPRKSLILDFERKRTSRISSTTTHETRKSHAPKSLSSSSISSCA